MNRLKIFVLGFVVLMATVNFTDNTAKNQAIAKREGDFYLFHLSIPANDYIVVNTIKAGTTWSGSPDQLFDNLIKKAKKEGIKFDGLIISDNMGSAEMIIYK